MFNGSFKSPSHTCFKLSLLLKSRSPILRGSSNPLNSVRSCEKSIPMSSRMMSALWNDRWKLLVYSHEGAPSYTSTIVFAAACI